MIYAIRFEEQSFVRTVVAHAPVTGSRGPRVGRGSRVAGPRPGTGGLLDRAREHDEPPGEDEEYEEYAALSAEELAEIEAHAHARKLAVVAALARRNPGTLDAEFTADQIAYALGESRARADSLIGMAQTLPARLPGTAAALEDGMISRYKAEIIARA